MYVIKHHQATSVLYHNVIKATFHIWIFYNDQCRKPCILDLVCLCYILKQRCNTCTFISPGRASECCTVAGCDDHICDGCHLGFYALGWICCARSVVLQQSCAGWCHVPAEVPSLLLWDGDHVGQRQLIIVEVDYYL